MTEQENSEFITIYTKGGAKQVLPLARWKETVGSGEYEFALHVIPVDGVYNPPLGLTEVSTGASMQADLRHPNGSGPLLESHTKPGHRGYLPAAKLSRLAYVALKKQINSVSTERFENMVGLNILARAQRDQLLAAQEKAQPAIDERRAEEEAADEAAFEQEQAALEDHDAPAPLHEEFLADSEEVEFSDEEQEKPLDDIEPEVEVPPAKSEAKE